MNTGDVFESKGWDELRFLVVLGVEGPREPGEVAVADVVVITPANRVAPAARLLVLPVDEVERRWDPVEVAEGGE